MKNKIALKRHLLKTITYRLLGTTVTFTSAYVIGGSFELASLLGIGELLFKPLLYFIHERFWFKYIKMKN